MLEHLNDLHLLTLGRQWLHLFTHQACFIVSLSSSILTYARVSGLHLAKSIPSAQLLQLVAHWTRTKARTLLACAE